MQQAAFDIFPTPDIRLLQGDCRKVMQGFDDNSIDTIITDPPYALEFMGKGWDKVLPDVGIWKECLRVAKPGAMMLVFGGDRTHHRLMVNIEDAGWEIRTCIYWLFGSGFPKSLNISKQLDKRKSKMLPIEFGNLCKEKRENLNIGITEADRLITGGTNNYRVWIEHGHRLPRWKEYLKIKKLYNLEDSYDEYIQAAEREIIGRPKDYCDGRKKHNWCKKPLQWETGSATPEAQLWNGWGTALKPAAEIICVAMKPLDGTFAENALKHGVAGLNIDGGRVGLIENDPNLRVNPVKRGKQKGNTFQNIAEKRYEVPRTFNSQGRWPANVIHDGSDEVMGLFPETKQIGYRKNPSTNKSTWFGKKDGSHIEGERGFNDQGSAARFFYCAKSSKAERNAGCEGLPEVECGMMEDDNYPIKTGSGNLRKTVRRNNHPTVKPLKLMEYLCKLTMTPTGGVVLDPFMGSGTTGIACRNLNRDFIGIEKDPEYFEIAKNRIDQGEES